MDDMTPDAQRGPDGAPLGSTPTKENHLQDTPRPARVVFRSRVDIDPAHPELVAVDLIEAVGRDHALRIALDVLELADRLQVTGGAQ